MASYKDYISTARYPENRSSFDKTVERFGLDTASNLQNPESGESVKSNLNDTSQKQIEIMKRNRIDTSMHHEPAKVPDNAPLKEHIIAKALDFDPMNTQSVANMQQRLNAAGYTDSNGQPLEVDGRFGPRTAYAKLALEMEAENPDEPIAPPMTSIGLDPIAHRTSTYNNLTKYKDDPHWSDPAPVLMRNHPDYAWQFKDSQYYNYPKLWGNPPAEERFWSDPNVERTAPQVLQKIKGAFGF